MLTYANMHDWLSKRDRDVPRHAITRHRRALLKQCFDSLDCDKSGSISRAELVHAARELGLDSAALGALLARGDGDGDGQLSFDEFTRLVAQLRLPARSGRSGSEAATKAKLPPQQAALLLPKQAGRWDEAARHQLAQLVERAGSFPLGIVANSEHIRKLVAGYDTRLLEAAEPGLVGEFRASATWRKLAATRRAQQRLCLPASTPPPSMGLHRWR